MASVTGGEALTKLLKKFAVGATNAKTVDVGFLPKATYPDGTHVATVAAIQDFGAPAVGIPPRPFFRNMVAEKQSEWPAAIAANFKANDYDADKTLAQVGAAIAGQLRQSIVDTNDPPLAPATIARKGFSKPLIDTSVMINSVDFQVNKE
jgi:hypothetical protein